MANLTAAMPDADADAAVASASASPRKRLALSARRASEVAHNILDNADQRLQVDRKRRSKSMGGDALSDMAAAAAANQGSELSPRKKARRSLVPGRSILKPSNSASSIHDETTTVAAEITDTFVHTHTMTAAIVQRSAGPVLANESTPGPEDDKDEPELANTTLNMSRRQSRRVSFAPTAQMREFHKDQDDDEPNANNSPPSNNSNLAIASFDFHSLVAASTTPAAAPEVVGALLQSSDLQPNRVLTGADARTVPHATNVPTPSPSKRRRSSIRSGAGHRRRSSVTNAESLVSALTTAASQPDVLKEGKERSSPSKSPKRNSQVHSSQNATQRRQSRISFGNGTEQDAERSSLMDMSMDLADTSSVTTAFKSHFIFPRSRSSSAEPERPPSRAGVRRDLDGHEEDNNAGSQSTSFMSAGSMELADQDEVTRAFALNTHLFGSSVGATQASKSNGESRRASLPSARPADHERDVEIPLGEEGIAEEDIERQQREKAKRGSALFYAARGSSSNATDDRESNPVANLFAIHHSPELFSGELQVQGGGQNGEEDDLVADETTDMSVVDDTRRMSNVFALAFGARLSDDQDEAAEEREEARPNSRTDRNPGEAALAFLDDDGGEDDPDLETPPPEDHHEIAATAKSPAIKVTHHQSPLHTPEETGSRTAEQPEGQQYFPLPDPGFVPRNSRLSVVPERAEEEEEGCEVVLDASRTDEDEDQTQDMEVTGTYGTLLTHQRESVRRLSIAPAPPSTTSWAVKQSTPTRTTPRKADMSRPIPVDARRSPSPIKSSQRRRQSLVDMASEQGLAKDENENFPSSGLLFKSAPARVAAPEQSYASKQSASTTPRSPGRVLRAVAPSAASSPVRAQRTPIAKSKLAAATGLTPAMDRLGPWASASISAAKAQSIFASPARLIQPAPNAPIVQHLPPAPASEGVFDEHDALEDQPVESNGYPRNDDHPQLTLEQFLSLTSVQFMDDMGPSVARRKSMMSASTRYNAALPNAEDNKPKYEVSLADQAIASAAILPFMDMYRMMVQELRLGLQDNGLILDELEETVNDETPQLFKDFLDAGEEDRAMLETQFKLTKTFYRLQTRNEWYEFKSGVLSSLVELLHTHASSLEADRSIVRKTREEVQAQLPALRSQAEELRAKLEKEKARQSLLESTDQEHLATLKADIREQASQLEDYTRENEKVQGELNRLTSRANEVDHLAQEARAAIEQSKKICDDVKFCTKGEMYRLQDELELLQYLHSWRLERFDARQVELHHGDEISLTLLLQQGGVVREFELFPLDTVGSSQQSGSDVKQAITAFLFDRLKGQLANLEGLHVRDLLRHIGHLWTAAKRIRAELLQLQHYYPMTISLGTKKSRSGPFLRASARIYCDAAQAEFSVVYEITGEEMAGDPSAVTSDVGCQVAVEYGNIDRDELVYIVRDRTSSGGPGALLEACREAEAKYA